MTHRFFEDKRPHKGKTFAEFEGITKLYLEETNPDALEASAKTKYDYKKLNRQRAQRIIKTYKPDEATIEIMKSVSEPQFWMVLTEDWCGDSAQNLPYIAKLAELNDNITLRILERDANPDIMDLYLTDGKSRSIPKLIAFNEAGEELFQWGPRPKEVVELIQDWKAEGLSKDEWTPKLHMWYAKNKGAALIAELKELVNKSISVEV